MTSIVERYAAAEQLGRAQVPNSAIEAFSLDFWNTVGYPHRIESLAELWRYHDSMQDGRYWTNLKLLGEVSFSDVDLCSEAASIIYKFSETRFPFASPARDALTRALYQYRLLCDQLHEVNHPWTVLEVGPGSGYLGLLLGLRGHHYRAVEAAQAYFVYQSELWRFAFGDQYSDGLSSLECLRVAHIPWWSFNQDGYSLPVLDAVTCNHALAEMHPNAINRVFAVTRRARQRECFLLAESLGKRYRPTSAVIQVALNNGFDAFELRSDLWIFSPTGAAAPTVTRRSVPRPLRFSLTRRIVKTPIGRYLSRRYAQLRDRNRHRRLDVIPGTTSSSGLRAVFDQFPDAATPDLRYRRGDW